MQEACTRKLGIGTYTTITVKLVGSCGFYLEHPDTKDLQEIAFYVASNNGSVLLSCAITLALGLIQPHTRLDYLAPRASLITSSDDHPKKTISLVSVHVSRKEPDLSTWYGTQVYYKQGTDSCLMVLDAFLGPIPYPR